MLLKRYGPEIRQVLPESFSLILTIEKEPWIRRELFNPFHNTSDLVGLPVGSCFSMYVGMLPTRTTRPYYFIWFKNTIVLNSPPTWVQLLHLLYIYLLYKFVFMHIKILKSTLILLFWCNDEVPGGKWTKDSHYHSRHRFHQELLRKVFYSDLVFYN